jgi:Ca2+-binding RTX toxin-like protein
MSSSSLADILPLLSFDLSATSSSSNRASRAYVGSDDGDVIRGDGENDVITGGLGRDRLYGEGGKDTFVYRDQADIVAGEIVSGGDGLDSILIDSPNGDPQTFDLSPLRIVGVEKLVGNGGNVVVTAGQLGALQYITAISELSVSTAGSIDLRGASLGIETLFLHDGGNTVNLTGAKYGAYGMTILGGLGQDVVTGSAGRDAMYGLGGDDKLSGGAGNDTLSGGAGRDRLYGGDGDDSFIYNFRDSVAAGEIVDGGAGLDTIYVDDIESNEIDISALKLSAVEALRGSDVAMTFSQFAGFSSFSSGSNLDIRLTTNGVTNLSGVLTGVDELVVQLRAGGNTLDFSNVTMGSANLEVRGGSGDDVVTGSVKRGDTLYGDRGNDVLEGLGGNDTIVGGAGSDTMYGGDGSDTFVFTSSKDVAAGEVIDGGSGLDILSFGLGQSGNISAATLVSIDMIDRMQSISMTAAQFSGLRFVEANEVRLTTGGVAEMQIDDRFGFETLHLSDHGNTISFGDALQSTTFFALAMTINGGRGSDRISGSNVSDIITGGLGADTMTGNGGSNQFRFLGPETTIDRIVDFKGDVDLNGNGTGGDTLAFGNTNGTFAYLGDGAFTGTGNTEVRFVSTGRLAVDYDGNGSVDQVIAIDGLSSANQLLASDFVVI